MSSRVLAAGQSTDCLQGRRLRKQGYSNQRQYLPTYIEGVNVTVDLREIDNLKQIAMDVTVPSGDANRLTIVVGTAVFTLTPPGDQQLVTDNLIFDVGPPHSPALGSTFRDAAATASLASISNQGPANNALWAVDSVFADLNPATGRVRVTARLVVRDSDGFLNRLGFQVNILSQVN
jgi:hypothetical protein